VIGDLVVGRPVPKQEFPDVVSQLGMALDELLEARPFSGSIARGELVGERGLQKAPR
jgi:hypothetical protein